MEEVEIYFGVFTLILSSILSGIVSLIVSKIEINRNNKKEIFERFYKKYYVLTDSIHQGCAYNFTDLSQEKQEEIVNLLIETDCYQNQKISDMVYELKTNRLNNFDNMNEFNINKCNELYILIDENITQRYSKFIKKNRKK